MLYNCLTLLEEFWDVVCNPLAEHNCAYWAQGLSVVGGFEMSTFSRLALLLFGASLASAENETQGLSGPWQGPCARVISCPGWRLNSLPKVKVGWGGMASEKGITNVRITPVSVSKRFQPPKMLQPKVEIGPTLPFPICLEVFFLLQDVLGISHSFNHCC